MRRYNYVNMHTLNAHISNFITQTAMGIKYHIGPDTIIIDDFNTSPSVRLSKWKFKNLQI